MQLFDESLRQTFVRTFYDTVDRPEMVRCLDDVVNIDRPLSDADGIRLEDISRLVMREAAAFDVIGVVRELDLRLVIDPARIVLAFFFA